MVIECHELAGDVLREILERHTVVEKAQPEDIMCIYADRNHCERSCVCYSETNPVLVGYQAMKLWTCARCGVTRYMLVDGDRTRIMKANGGKIYGDL